VSPDELDEKVRLAAFAFLEGLVREFGDSLPRGRLEQGFSFDGQRVPLVGPQGIFKPAVLPRIPLSITTAPRSPRKPRPYDDGFLPDGSIVYRYRGTDPQHHENAGLREAMLREAPLVYFHGIEPGLYVATWPVYVTEDRARELAFVVEVDRAARSNDTASLIVDTDLRRRYSVVTTRARLHQEAFRERVLRAYRERCALCKLRHRELLEAAHIVPDSDPLGEPLVSNGLALCKLHHAAFDGHLIGIRPDLLVEVRRDILQEEDGPMLIHGLQGFHQRSITVPSDRRLRPNPEFLGTRYDLFRRAS
jgi:putative restriction endonuclease